MSFTFENLTVYQKSLDLVAEAQGSVFEIVPIVQVIQRKGLIDERAYDSFYQQLEALAKMLTALIL